MMSSFLKNSQVDAEPRIVQAIIRWRRAIDRPTQADHSFVPGSAVCHLNGVHCRFYSVARMMPPMITIGSNANRSAGTVERIAVFQDHVTDCLITGHCRQAGCCSLRTQVTHVFPVCFVRNASITPSAGFAITWLLTSSPT